MPRLRQVPKSEATAPIVTTMYEWLFEGRDPVTEPGTFTGAPGDWWTVFALVPDVLDHAVKGFGLYQSPTRILDPALRELGQIRAGWAAGSQFVFSQHAKSMREMGIPEVKIASIPAWTVADCYDATERAVLAYTDCLVYAHGRVPDALFAELRRRLSDEAILELTYITTLYFQHAVMSRALRTEFDDRDDPIVEVPGPPGASAMRPGPAPPPQSAESGLAGSTGSSS
jgi:alkylhydroperoxidase family enzyme